MGLGFDCGHLWPAVDRAFDKEAMITSFLLAICVKSLQDLIGMLGKSLRHNSEIGIARMTL